MSDYFKINTVFISADLSNQNEIKDDGSTDVIVELVGGDKYAATFSTEAHLQLKLNTEEIHHQHYLWIKNMVVVKSIGKETVESVVKEMIDEGDFQMVFEKLSA